MLKMTKQHLFTTTIVSLGSFILLTTLLIGKNIDQVMSAWGKETKISVYLEDQINATQAGEIKNKISSLNYIKNVKYKTSSDAAIEFQNNMNQYSKDLFTNEEVSTWLPASFEVIIDKSKIENMGIFLKSTAQEIQNIVGVSEVSYGQEWINRLEKYINVFKITFAIFCVTALFISFLLIGSSIRQSVFDKLEEIKVLELVGATHWMIRKPFLIQGIFISLNSALLGLFAIYGFFRLINRWLMQEMNGIIHLKIYFFSFSEIFLIVLNLVIVGAIAGYVSAKNLNSGWASVQK